MRVFEEWMDLVIEADLPLRWTAMAILRKEVTPMILEKMRKSGCDQIMWGLESGCHETLRLMNKTRFTLGMAEDIFIRAHTLGIRNATNIIVGFPTETEKHFQESLLFVNKIKSFFTTMSASIMLMLPNAPIYKKAPH